MSDDKVSISMMQLLLLLDLHSTPPQKSNFVYYNSLSVELDYGYAEISDCFVEKV